MKLVYKKRKYLGFNKDKAEDRNRRRLEYKRWKSNKFRILNGINKQRKAEINTFNKSHPGYTKIEAPVNFSFLNNTEQVIKFIASLKCLYDKKKKVYVELTNIDAIDYSAIVVLLSIMIKFKSAKIDFTGSMPREKMPKEILEKSGFFENLYKKFEDKESYDISKFNSNCIHTHASKKVDPLLSSTIIASASEHIWDEQRRCQGVQRTLIELMQNTNNHAEIGKPGEKHWWLSVNRDKKSKTVSFSFVDFGVGIFTNLQNKTEKSKFFRWQEKMSLRFKYGSNADLLKLIVDGDLHQTVTEKSYRGKGLPGVAEAMRRNQISNLHIITNDVFSCPSSNLYRKLDMPFNGTFVYWELGEKNDNCK